MLYSLVCCVAISSVVHGLSSFFPKASFNGSVVPRCTSTFCEQVHSYPEHALEKTLRHSKYRNEFFTEPWNEETLRRRLEEEDDSVICPTRRQIVYPRVAVNVKNQARFIFNFGEYRQPVPIEVCVNEEECRFFSQLPRVVSRCQQKRIEVVLLSADEVGQPYVDKYLFPSACVCSYKRDTGYSNLNTYYR